MTKDIEKSVSFTRMLSTSVGMAHRDKVINKDDYDYIIKTVNELGANGAIGGEVGSMPERCREIMEKCMNHMVTQVLDVLGED
jgi:dihydrodipicolinate synthase/N-acetylneuraminate lyase